MSKVILYIATSLDGYIAKPDHDLSWLAAIKQEDEDYGYQDFLNNIDSILMGNRSFEVINHFGKWPYVGKRCFVASHSPISMVHDSVTFVTDPAHTIKQLKSEAKGNIWLLGGADLADSLLRLDLVDEMIISTVPILLGQGIRLFSAPLPQLNLTLLTSQTYSSGLVQSHYRLKAK